METQSLPCKLTAEELDRRRDEMAQLVMRIDELQAERKDTAAALKLQEKTCTKRLHDLSQEVSAQKEYRPVEVKRSKDLMSGIEVTVRLDTGEVIDRRSLSASERQGDMFDSEVTQ